MSGYFGFSGSSGGGGVGGGTSSAFNDLVPTDGTAAGFSDGNYLRPAKVFDLDQSGGQDFNLGVNLRTYGPSGSKEIGVSANPLIVNLPEGFANFYKELGSPNFTEIDLHNSYQINSNIYSSRTTLSSTVTYDSVLSQIKLTLGTANTALAEIRTNQYFKVQLGKVSIYRQAIQFDSLGNNNSTSIGPFDDDNGFYFKVENSSLKIGFVDSMSTGLTNEYSNTSFNVDKLDGSGPSGIILDLTKLNLYEIRAAWHGILYLEYYVNGFLVHKLSTYNLTSKPILKINKLPLSVKSINTGISTVTTVNYNSASILVQNGQEPYTTSYSIGNDQVKYLKSETPVLSIKIKSTINSQINRTVVIPKKIFMFTNGSRIKYKLILNSTLTGSSFTSVNTNSGIEYDTNSSSYSGGDLIFSGYLASQDKDEQIDISNLFSLYGKNLKQDCFLTNTDILTVVVASDSEVFTRVSSTIIWNEE